MKLSKKVKDDLDLKFQKVLQTPAGFDFFVAIHDFVEHIELHSALSRSISSPTKSTRALKIPAKYDHLKEIYQGVKDASTLSNADLGHLRYMVLADLNRIKNKNFSDSNSFWKKRETFRKLAGEVYDTLNESASQIK